MDMSKEMACRCYGVALFECGFGTFGKLLRTNGWIPKICMAI